MECLEILVPNRLLGHKPHLRLRYCFAERRGVPLPLRIGLHKLWSDQFHLVAERPAEAGIHRGGRAVRGEGNMSRRLEKSLVLGRVLYFNFLGSHSIPVTQCRSRDLGRNAVLCGDQAHQKLDRFI